MHDVLVLVTEQSDIRRLLLAGESIAASEGKPLRLVSVRPRNTLRENPGAMVEGLFSMARDAHAELTVYYHDAPAEIATRCVSRYQAAIVVTGIPETLKDSETVGRLRSACPDIPIQLVDNNGMLSGYPAMLALAHAAACV